MNSEWRQLTIADIADINPRRPIQKGSCAPFVEMANVPTHSRDIDDTITTREHKGSGSKFQNGDTLLARITPCLENGKTALVSCLPDDVIGHGSTEFIVLAPKNENDTSFIYYLVRSDAFRDYAINRMEGTSGRQRVPTAAVASYEFRCPPPLERKELSDFLSALDDRIALLRETNKTLEAIAQAIFKSWFVDFDPVRAKMEGRQPEGMDEETAALFPDEFEESELGLIPQGWTLQTMSDVATVGIGKTPPRKEPEWFSTDPGDIRWVSIRDMGMAGVFASETNEFLTREAIEKFKVRVVPNNTVLMSFKMTIGRIAITDGVLTTNEAIAHFKLNPNSPLSTEHIYLYLKQFDFSTLSSTSSIADAVNSQTVREIPILVPDPLVVAVFQNHVDSIFQQLKNNEKLVQTLASLRDVLLPRLVSGRLTLNHLCEDLNA